MNLLECFKVAISGLRANKMRSFLTMLGVIIGVAAVIAVLAVAQGGQTAIIREIESMGSNLIWAQPHWENDSTRPVSFTYSDVKQVKESCPAIVAATTENNSRMTGLYGNKKMSINVYGVDEDYAEVRNAKLGIGRFLMPEDVAKGRRVAVIGSETATQLFGSQNPIGQTIRLDRNLFVVIGILARTEQGMTGMNIPNDSAMIPITTFEQISGYGDQLWVIYAKAESGERIPQAMQQMKLVLGRHYALNKIDVQNMESIQSSVNKVTSILKAIIGGIASVSLLVGGIGIMNIMLVSVTERTREIGLRKAIGARRRDILIQFMIEAIVLSAIGGIIGIIFGYLLVTLIAKLANLPSLVSLGSIAIALGFSAGVGIFFGIYPANKAAKLDPIEALRYE